MSSRILSVEASCNIKLVVTESNSIFKYENVQTFCLFLFQNPNRLFCLLSSFLVLYVTVLLSSIFILYVKT